MAGNRIKGITIEIGGNATKLTDALKKVDTSLANTQKSLKDVNNLLKLDPKNTELLRQRQELLGQAVKDTEEKLKLEKEALEQLKASGDTSAEAIKQQQALEREIFSTSQMLESYQEQANKSSVSLEKLGQTSKEVAEKTKALSATATALGGALLGNAIKAAANADDLNTLSGQTGLSVEMLQKMKYAEDVIDVSTEEMAGSIQKMTKQMASGNKTFEELGISITDADGNMRDATDVWFEALEALSQIDNETERDAKSMELFGKSAMNMAGIVDDGGKALKDLGQEAEDLGLIMSQDMVDDANEMQDAIDKMKARTSQAFLTMGSALAKTLVPAFERVLAVITKVVQWFANLSGSTQKVILIIAGLVAAISPVAAIFSKVTTAISTVKAALVALNPTVLIIIGVLAALVAAGVAVYQNWDTIKQKATDLWNNITTTFNNLKTSVSEIFENIRSTIATKIDAAKQVVQNAVEKIKGFFSFDWELPKLKLPHIKLSKGKWPWGLFGEGEAPKVSIDWYKKAMQNGMILNGPTIFGMNKNGQLMGGGEAGSEAIVGTGALQRMIQQAVASKPAVNINVYAQDQNVYQLADIVMNRLTAQTMRQSEVYR